MSQISELSKGLIFRVPLSEWSGTRDEVSGVSGVATDVYNVLDRQGSGRREVVYNGTSSYTTLPTIPAFGTGDFTVIVKVSDLYKYRIISGASTSFAINRNSDNTFFIDDGSSTLKQGVIVGISGGNTIVYKRQSNVGYLYVNGVQDGSSFTDNSSYTALTELFHSAIWEDYGQGSISMCRIFNNSTVDITYYSKPENPIKVADLTACKLNLNAEGLSQSTSGYWYDKTNSLTATNSSTTLVIPPASNLKAMAFNGTTSKIVYSGLTALPSGNSDRTISFWIFPTDITGFKQIVVYGTDAANQLIYIYLNNGKLLFGNGANGTDSNTTLSINIWYNVGFVYTGSSAKYYVNGVYDGVSTGMTSTNTVLSSLRIGASLGDLYFFSGVIASGNVWNRALDTDQIKLVYDTGF